MTTHELAGMLDHMRTAFAFGLSKPAANDLEAVSGAFRDGPDQKVSEFLKAIRAARTPAASGAAKSPPADVAVIVERIRAVRDGTEPAESVPTDFAKLTGPNLKDILRAFGGKLSGTKSELVPRVRQLVTRAATPVGDPPPAPDIDPVKVVESVETLTRLRDAKEATVAELRSSFEPIRELPKPAVEEIAKQMGYTLSGSKKEVLDRLLSNLEGIKMSQYRAEVILNAV